MTTKTLKTGRRGRPRKVTQDESSGITAINPFDIYKSCYLSYDNMADVNWDGEKYNEKIIVLVKEKDRDNKNISFCSLYRGLDEFNPSCIRGILRSLYPSSTKTFETNDVIEKLVKLNLIIIRGEKDNRAYIFKISNNPHITDFRVGGLLEFLNKGYSCSQIIDKVLATLEFFGEDLSNFKLNNTKEEK